MIKEKCNHPEYAVVDHTCTYCGSQIQAHTVSRTAPKPATQLPETPKVYKRQDFSHLVNA